MFPWQQQERLWCCPARSQVLQDVPRQSPTLSSQVFFRQYSGWQAVKVESETWKSLNSRHLHPSCDGNELPSISG